jgi:hypothetical protein
LGLAAFGLASFGAMGLAFFADFLASFAPVWSGGAVLVLGLALAAFARGAGFVSRAMLIPAPDQLLIFALNDYSGMDALSLWFIIA